MILTTAGIPRELAGASTSAPEPLTSTAPFTVSVELLGTDSVPCTTRVGVVIVMFAPLVIV